jgi:hypothetical protein
VVEEAIDARTGKHCQLYGSMLPKEKSTNCSEYQREQCQLEVPLGTFLVPVKLHLTFDIRTDAANGRYLNAVQWLLATAGLVGRVGWAE